MGDLHETGIFDRALQQTQGADTPPFHVQSTIVAMGLDLTPEFSVGSIKTMVETRAQRTYTPFRALMFLYELANEPLDRGG